MRVDERTLSEQASVASSRAEGSQRIQLDTATSSRSSASNAADRVDLSGLTGRISQAMQSLSQSSAQRVSQLRKQYQAGHYQPSAQQIGHAMAARAWSSGKA
jgi:anti-sigma28 factor (negative regulator of flagellin synthesis)